MFEIIPASSHGKLLRQGGLNYLDAIVSVQMNTPTLYHWMVLRTGIVKLKYEHKARLFLYYKLSTFLKSLSAKLQKLDQDVYEALTMVMIVVENLITT